MNSRRRIGMAILALCAVALAVSSLGAVAASSSAARTASGCPWLHGSGTADHRAREVLAAMTLDDKIAMVHQPAPDGSHYGAAGYIPANSRLCIPELVLNDAGEGVGDFQVGTVAFPAGIAQASSWDSGLVRAFGHALGWEAWHKGINVMLAPDVNIARVPMNGRNSEAMGEDPFLSGQMGSAAIQGIQRNPVIATVKHYALNNDEQNRMTVSADASQRTIHEIYTPAFQTAVQQGRSGSVMCSYNRINNGYACQNRAMLTGILKNQFGFGGWVMSDWNATHSTVASARAGLDMEMSVGPGTYFGSALKQAVQSGQVPVSRLNDMVLRILRQMFEKGIFAHPHAAQPQAYAANVERASDIALARRVSEEGTVLLKDAGSVLPITGTLTRIAVIGSAGGPVGSQLSYETQGSAHVPLGTTKSDVVTPFQAIAARGASDHDVVTYADGSSMADAVATAAAANVAVVFANDVESEGQDRPNLSLADAQGCSIVGCTRLPTNQDQLIENVARVNPHTVVVLDTGGPMLMPWLGKVKGVFQAWYPGQEDGNAIAALLFGDVNPSGKLPETFPASMAQLPTRTARQYPGVNNAQGVPQESYSEGLLVGYRWYDARHLRPLFPFGFGLSYTTFALSKASIRTSAHGGAAVTFTVRNTGHRAGAEVSQVYVALPRWTGEPPKSLAGFARVSLGAGRRRTLTISLGPRAFSYWSARLRRWTEPAACDVVLLGTSSRAIVTRRTVAIGGARCAVAAARGRHAGRPPFTG